MTFWDWFFSLSGEGNGTPLQYSCLENPMDGGPWWAAVHGVAKSQTWLSDFAFTFHFHALEKEMATHSSVLAWRIPGTGEAWRAAVYRVAQSRTRLKWLILPFSLKINLCWFTYIVVCFAGLFFLLSSSPWYIYTRVCLTIPPLNLDCFQFGVITNKDVINICVQVFIWTYIYFSGIMRQSIISGSHGTLISWKKKKPNTANLFSRIAVLFYIPINNVWVIQFLHIFVTIWWCSYFFKS